MKKLATVVVAIACALAFVTGATGPASASDPSSTAASPLSTIGRAAVADVRQCLSTNSHLDIYYLVDASGSLFTKPGQPGTDPSKVRADLIGNSLSELATVKPGLDVRYSSGFFGTQFKAGLPWTPVTPQSAATESARLKQSIADQPSLGWTNWPAGIQAAQAALAAEKAQSNGCQILVWLTDGGINISGNNDALDNAGLNNLCGSQIKSTAPAPHDGLGPFNQMRKDGVVVFGVLLQVADASTSRDKANIPYMRPLVESTGTVNGTTVMCGESPIPKDYVSGGLIVANNPSELALVFLQLGAALSGGYPAPFKSDGSFVIDAGVSAFSVVTASPTWTLHDPSGQAIASNGLKSSDPRVSTQTTGGATEVHVAISTADSVGKWKWTSTVQSSDNLYLYSGLAISLTHPKSLLAGIPGALGGTIVRTDGRALDLKDFAYELGLSVVSADGKSIDHLATATANSKTGAFALSVPTTVSPGDLTFQVSLDQLTTRPSGSALASVSARETVQVTVPAEYPSVTPVPLKLSELDGSSGRSTGVLVFHAPADGTAGEVCLSSAKPIVTSDAVKRAQSWEWSFTPSASVVAECVKLPAHSTKRITVTASNSEAANSAVRAQLPVTYVTAHGKKLRTTLQFTFNSVRPLNGAVVGGLALLLLLLGILIPLGLLYLINFLGARIAYDSKTLRASFPIRIHRDGNLTNPDGSDFRSTTFGLDQFKFRSPGSNAKRLSDEDLGTLMARTSRNPFKEPNFDIVPPAGRLVFSMAGAQSSSRREVEQGRRSPFGGVLSRVAAVVLSESALSSLDSTAGAPGNLVVYVSGDGYAKRMADVLANLPRVGSRIAKAKSLFEQASASAAAAPSVDKPSANRPATDAAAPPARRTDGAPPPPPRRDHASPPPARGATDPPPQGQRPGGSMPPPPGSSSDSGGPPPPPPRRR